MTGQGRPLRFLALVLCGWVGVRVAALWPRIDSVPALIDAVVPHAQAAEAPRLRREVIVAVPPPQRLADVARAPRVATFAATAVLPAARIIPASGIARQPIPVPLPVQAGVPRPAVLASTPTSTSRLSGSAWLLVRPGSGISSGVIGGQLGGSQAGVRLAYALDDGRHLAAAARVTTPLARGQRELAVGLEWRPGRLPLRFVAEQRFAIDGGRGGPALGVVGGVGPVPVGGGFAFDGYAQAGAIKRDVVEGYVDGAAHVAHHIARLGGARFELGAAAWGAAQRGASRIDLGPSLVAVVPLGRQPVRLSLDWRERVAGNARPGSGLAFTLGTDF